MKKPPIADSAKPAPMAAPRISAKSSGAREARLHAQAVAQPFYRKLGFIAFGPMFDEDGIAHIAMRQPLPRSPTDKSR